MSEKQSPSIFSRDNYRWMLIGGIVIAAGMLLMSGGKSNTDPSVFNKAAVYSTTRITIAPILILIGLGIEVFALFKQPRAAKD